MPFFCSEQNCSVKLFPHWTRYLGNNLSWAPVTPILGSRIYYPLFRGVRAMFLHWQPSSKILDAFPGEKKRLILKLTSKWAKNIKVFLKKNWVGRLVFLTQNLLDLLSFYFGDRIFKFPRLALNWPCSQGWPWTSASPASASLVLQLHVRPITQFWEWLLTGTFLCWMVKSSVIRLLQGLCS